MSRGYVTLGDLVFYDARKKSFQRMVTDLPNNRAKFTMLLAEFLGTAGILFFGCMGCTPLVAVDALNPAIAFGGAVSFVVICFGHISGAHFNPAVTLASIIYGNLPVLMAPLYIIAQYLGATAGFGLLKLLIPDQYMTNGEIGVCTTIVHPEVSHVNGMLIEFFTTGALILSVCAVWDDRNSKNTDSTAIKIGFLVALLALVAGPLTCASINPARSFGPALLNGNWDHHWVYVCGPLSAGVVFSIFYVFLFGTCARQTTKKVTEDDAPLTSSGQVRHDANHSV